MSCKGVLLLFKPDLRCYQVRLAWKKESVDQGRFLCRSRYRTLAKEPRSQRGAKRGFFGVTKKSTKKSGKHKNFKLPKSKQFITQNILKTLKF